MRGNVFSESWYKVSSLQVSLNTNSYIKKQIYRNELWYVIEDSYNNQFFKLKQELYEFIVRLKADKTVEEVWEECLLISPNNAPTQDQVIHLLTSLHHKNLLYFKNRADTKQLFDRAEKRKTSEIKGKLFSFLYIKVPLFDPNNWLNSVKPFIDFVFSKKGFVIWLISILIGLKYTIENFSKVYDQTEGMLAPNNLFLLYFSIIFLKSLHELGHAMMVKKFGGRVHSMGVMILVFTPIPFMDATQSWLFRSKYQRALVGAAGMIVELFIAAIAVVIWANTGDGIVHSIAFNIMIIGSLSSLFFNGNPLLRFDSYFILSDLLEIPNLYERSKKQWFYFFEKYIFRFPYAISPSNSLSEAIWMYFYAVGSFFYRIFVSLIIALFVADQWFFLGVLVVVLSLYMWIIKPFFSFMKYLLSDNKFQKNRLQSISIAFAIVSFLVILIGYTPLPFSIKANGIILSDNYNGVYIQSKGYMKELNVQDGDYVKKGEILAIFENKELDFEIKNLSSSIKETLVYLDKARSNVKADLVPIKKHLALLIDRRNFFIKRKKELIVIANNEGYFIYNDLKNPLNTWFSQGQKLGSIIPNKEVHFQAVVLQEESYNLFQTQKLMGTIRINGIAENLINVNNVNVIPYQKQELPSAALGWLGGGEIATSNTDESGTKTRESFYEVRAEIKKEKDLAYLHGRSGILKIDLDPLTIAQRVTLSVKQILQKHYKI